MGLAELAGIILSRATSGVELSAQNVANATTPGYKTRISFTRLLSPDVDGIAAPQGPAVVDYSAGALQSTGNPLDLAISGNGFFVVKNESGTLYSRNGEFSRDSSGRLVTADGCILQSTSGDLVVGAKDPTVLPDGTVLDGEEPVGRILLSDFADRSALRSAGPGLFSGPEQEAFTASATVRQGMLEASNVSTSAEMIATMASLRSAQAGQHIMQAYDDLMGRALTTFGQP